MYLPTYNSDKKYLEQRKEIKRSWTGAEMFDIYFYIIFDRYYKRETKH